MEILIPSRRQMRREKGILLRWATALPHARSCRPLQRCLALLRVPLSVARTRRSPSRCLALPRAPTHCPPQCCLTLPPTCTCCPILCCLAPVPVVYDHAASHPYPSLATALPRCYIPIATVTGDHSDGPIWARHATGMLCVTPLWLRSPTIARRT